MNWLLPRCQPRKEPSLLNRVRGGWRLPAGYRQEGLESGWRFLPVCNRTFNLSESRAFKQACDFDFRKPEMGIGVKFARLFERMLEEIENHDFSVGFEDPMDLFESTRWI